MVWVIFVAGAVLSWGAYGALLHQGQTLLGSPLKALLCVGIAYFLIGVIVPAPDGGKKLKPGKPFLVGNGGTITPRETGLLFLKVNAPAGHKSIGRLKVRMTGNVRKP